MSHDVSRLIADRPCGCYSLLRIVVKANAKCQTQSDELLRESGFTSTLFIPQLFIPQEVGRVVVIVAKIVDDLLLASPSERGDRIVKDIDRPFMLATITHGHASMCLFGGNMAQDTENSVLMDGDDKLPSLAPPRRY